jgi:hypothetical protein
MPVCRHTGLSRPECSCPECLTEQIRRFRPGLIQADPVGEIRVGEGEPKHPAAERRRAA